MAELNSQLVRHKSNKLHELDCHESMLTCVCISTCLTCLALNHRLCDPTLGEPTPPLYVPRSGLK